jgi:hypothetical protein
MRGSSPTSNENPPQSPFACLGQGKDTKGGGCSSQSVQKGGREGFRKPIFYVIIKRGCDDGRENTNAPGSVRTSVSV